MLNENYRGIKINIYNLHNASFMGTYYYVTRKPSENVLKILSKTPYKLSVPLHMGEAEAPYMHRLEKVVFRMPSTVDVYDWLEKHSNKDPAEILKRGGGAVMIIH